MNKIAVVYSSYYKDVIDGLLDGIKILFMNRLISIILKFRDLGILLQNKYAIKRI